MQAKPVVVLQQLLMIFLPGFWCLNFKKMFQRLTFELSFNLVSFSSFITKPRATWLEMMLVTASVSCRPVAQTHRTHFMQPVMVAAESCYSKCQPASLSLDFVTKKH